MYADGLVFSDPRKLLRWLGTGFSRTLWSNSKMAWYWGAFAVNVTSTAPAMMSLINSYFHRCTGSIRLSDERRESKALTSYENVAVLIQGCLVILRQLAIYVWYADRWRSTKWKGLINGLAPSKLRVQVTYIVRFDCKYFPEQGSSTFENFGVHAKPGPISIWMYNKYRNSPNEKYFTDEGQSGKN